MAATSIGIFHVHPLDRGGLDGGDHAADAEAGGDGEAGVDRDGEEKVGEDGDLVVVTLQVDLLAPLDGLAADGEGAVGLEVVS